MIARTRAHLVAAVAELGEHVAVDHPGVGRPDPAGGRVDHARILGRSRAIRTIHGSVRPRRRQPSVEVHASRDGAEDAPADAPGAVHGDDVLAGGATAVRAVEDFGRPSAPPRPSSAPWRGALRHGRPSDSARGGRAIGGMSGPHIVQVTVCWTSEPPATSITSSCRSNSFHPEGVRYRFGVRRIDLEQHHVVPVGVGVGEAPGHVRVAADHDSGNAGQRDANHAVTAAGIVGIAAIPAPRDTRCSAPGSPGACRWRAAAGHRPVRRPDTAQLLLPIAPSRNRLRSHSARSASHRSCSAVPGCRSRSRSGGRSPGPQDAGRVRPSTDCSGSGSSIDSFPRRRVRRS